MTTATASQRLLIVTPSFLPVLGGQEEQCYLLGLEFLRQGWHVDILTEQALPNSSSRENLEGLQIYRIAPTARRTPLFYLRLSVAMIRFLVPWRRRYDLVIVRTFTFHGLVVGLLKRIGLFTVPTVVSADSGGDGDELLFVKNSRLRSQMVWLFGGHSYFNSITQSNLENMRGLGFDASKFLSIYNGVPVAPYRSTHYPESVKTFLFLGRLSRSKGVYELLEAFAELYREDPRLRLRIAGDGPETQRMAEFVRVQQLENVVELLGRISREEKAAFFESGQCLVLPSYSEGFPMVVGEAALHKRLVVATDVSDLRKVYGEQILYCATRDVPSLVCALKKAVLTNPAAVLNYDAAMEQLDLENIVARFSALVGRAALAPERVKNATKSAI